MMMVYIIVYYTNAEADFSIFLTIKSSKMNISLIVDEH